MKTENDYNAFLSKQLKKFSPQVHTIKISDKFTAGISDFLIFCNHKSLGLETKFEKAFPKRETSQVLSHSFSGPQITFLESLALTGNMGYGVVCIEEEESMYVFPYQTIPANGNFTLKEFNAKFIAKIPMKDIESLVEFFFNWRP
jgi:hypothetical protein